MARFRKKPVFVEAVQFTQTMADSWVLDREPLPVGVRCDRSQHNHITREIRYAVFSVKTSEGRLNVLPGDWLITDINGEMCPCKPDIFATTYEPAG